MKVRYEHRSPHPYGRFGGGWQFCVGVKVGGRTVVLELGVATLRFDRKSRLTYLQRLARLEAAGDQYGDD